MNRVVIGAIALCIGCFSAGAAQARNPHCAGGIQYLAQWRGDKEKGNLDDYRRELMKSIQQLEMCAAEDPKDFEAIGYLGWSYAEADSAGAAGKAFATAIEGLSAKGDKKGAERVTTNRDSYWATAFNDGIFKIKTAQELAPEYCKMAEGAEKAAATKKFEEALVSLRRASLLKPCEVRTMRNLGVVYALRCDYAQAAKLFADGLKCAPNDSDLVQSLKSARKNIANQLSTEKKYDEAIAYFTDLGKTDPRDPDLQIGLADSYFQRAQSKEGDGRKPDFKAAGDAYAKAGELRAGDSDLHFNAALAYQNAAEWELSEKQWRKAAELKPNDPAIPSALAAVLAELKKFDDAIKILHQAVVSSPKDKGLHRQLGAIYTKAGNNQKGTEELMVYLSLQNGSPAADTGAEAKKAAAGSQAAKTLASVGMPEQIYPWVAEGEKWESWFYWSKRLAYHFKSGVLIQKSDWTAPDLKAAK